MEHNFCKVSETPLLICQNSDIRLVVSSPTRSKDLPEIGKNRLGHICYRKKRTFSIADKSVITAYIFLKKIPYEEAMQSRRHESDFKERFYDVAKLNSSFTA